MEAGRINALVRWWQDRLVARLAGGSRFAPSQFSRQRVLVASLQAENRKIRPEMAVLRPETRPDGPGLTGNSVFRPDPAKLTLPGPVRATFGHFRGRLSCHVMSSHLISCHVMSCHVMSCHVMSCDVM